MVSYLVLQMAHGDLTLSVPPDTAPEVGMHPPIGNEEVEDLFELLGKKDTAIYDGSMHLWTKDPSRPRTKFRLE